MPRKAFAFVALLAFISGCATTPTTTIVVEQSVSHHGPTVKAEFKFN